MSDVMIRALGEADWEEFRDIRLQALTESPDAFAAKLSDEQRFDEDFWKLRLRRSTRFVAETPERLLGVVSLGMAHDEDGEVPGVGEIFGLWVHPDARGSGVATKLLKAGAERAREDGLTHVAFWVGTDNGKAVAFASGMGFRPTDSRRPMRLPDGTELGETEIAMVLPLGDDRGAPKRL